MPWVYTLTLSSPVEARAVQDDWEANVGGGDSVINDMGGVTVSGRRAVIVSKRRDPGYQDMANLDYVITISESKEIPGRQDADPPIYLGNGIHLMG